MTLIAITNLLHDHSHAFAQNRIVGQASRTGGTTRGGFVVVLVAGAGQAAVVLEERRDRGAGLADTVNEVVDLSGGAVEALESVVVPVLRDVARDAGRRVPEGAIGAHALAGARVVDSVQGAGLAYFGGGVEMLGGVTGGALGAVEEGSDARTGDASAADGIVNHVVLAEDAGLLGVVEVFGHKAVDAVGCVPVCSSRALASAIDQHLATRTRQALSNSPIPQSIVRTMPASRSVEVRRRLGTVNALLEGDIINGISFAQSAGEEVVVEVVGEEARDAV